MEFLKNFQKNNSYSLFIVLTSICNLNCYGCGAGCSQNNSFNYMVKTDELKNNLQTIKEKCPHLKQIVLTGGEPLLHPNFINICEMIRKLFPSIEIIIFTNGIGIINILNKEIENVKKLDLLFSISLYPKESILEKELENINFLQKNKIRTTGFFDKSRPYFYNPGLDLSKKENGKEHFNQCNKKDEDFFILLDNKLFGCDNSILFFNKNISIKNDSYITCTELQSEEQLFKLKSTPCSMCNLCSYKFNSGTGFTVWHTQNELKNLNLNENSDIKEMFLTNYKAFQVLQDDDKRLFNALQYFPFEFGVMKRTPEDGYNRLMKKYFFGEKDVFFYFTNQDNLSDQILNEVSKKLSNLKNKNDINFYFCCINLTQDQEELIYNYLCPSKVLLNTYLIKSIDYLNGFQYFLEHKYLEKYQIVNLNNYDILFNN